MLTFALTYLAISAALTLAYAVGNWRRHTRELQREAMRRPVLKLIVDNTERRMADRHVNIRRRKPANDRAFPDSAA